MELALVAGVHLSPTKVILFGNLWLKYRKEYGFVVIFMLMAKCFTTSTTPHSTQGIAPACRWAMRFCLSGRALNLSRRISILFKVGRFLFHPAIFHFHALLVILLALASGRLNKRDAHHQFALYGHNHMSAPPFR